MELRQYFVSLRGSIVRANTDLNTTYLFLNRHALRKPLFEEKGGMSKF